MNAAIFVCETSHKYRDFKTCEVWHGFSLFKFSHSPDVGFQYQVMIRGSVANDQVAYMTTHFVQENRDPNSSTHMVPIAELHGVLSPNDLGRFRASNPSRKTFTHINLNCHNYESARRDNWFEARGPQGFWWKTIPHLQARRRVDGEIEMSLLDLD